MANKINSKNMSKRATDAYGKVIKDEPAPKDNSEVQSFYWWKADEDDMGRQIESTITFIASHQSTRLEKLTMGSRLYGTSNAFNFIGPGLARNVAATGTASSSRITFNLCSSVVDTLVAKTAKNKIIPTFITNGGIWGMQHKAEQLNKFAEGIGYEQDIDTKKNIAVRDSGVWGTGGVHVYEDDDEVKVERVFPHEFFIDEVEALTGNPRQMHRVKPADRDLVLAMIDNFPDGKEKDKAIEIVKNAKSSSYVDVGGIGTAADVIMISESFHLRSSKKSKDGVHALVVNGQLIYKDEWEYDYFPYPMLNYSNPLFGAWGAGACERLTPIQTEVNRLMILVQRSMWMGGSFKVLIENGSRVVSQHLNNDVGALIFYTGTPPQYVTPPMIQQDIYPYIDSLIAKGFQQEGVSQMQANSMKPQGIDSGEALRTYDTISDDRFLFFEQQVERFVLEIYKQMIDRAKDIYSRKKKFKVSFPTSQFLETIDWADIKLKEDEYVMRAYPTSSLPDDPAGRRQEVQEQAQAGWITPRQARKLMQMPDVEMSDKLANAAEQNLQRIFEDILNKEEFKSVEPQWDLQLAGQLYAEYYNYAELHNAPEGVMNKLREFKDSLDDVNGVAAQAVAGQQAIQTLQAMQQQQSQPQANPMPTPQSDLIPNTPTAA